MVEVRFASHQLYAACSTKQGRIAHFGSAGAKALVIRFAQLRVLDTLDDLALMPCDTGADSGGGLRIPVDVNLTLIVNPVGPPRRALEAFEVTHIEVRTAR